MSDSNYISDEFEFEESSYDDSFINYIEILANNKAESLFESKNRLIGAGEEEFFINHFNSIAMGMPLHYLKTFEDPNEKTTNKKVFEFDIDNPEEEKLEEVNLFKIIGPYIKKFDKVVTCGYSFYFYGDNSRGKTHTALNIAHVIYKRRKSKLKFYYINARELYKLYNDTHYSFSEGSSLDYYNTIVGLSELLIIDEFGKEGKVTDNVISTFEEIIRLRASKNLPTIMLGNMRPYLPRGSESKGTSINNRYGQSVYAAMTEKFRFFAFSSTQNPNERVKRKWQI